MTGADVDVVAQLVARRLADDSALHHLVNANLDPEELVATLSAVAHDAWVAEDDGRVIGHLVGTLLASDTYGHGAWVGPDAVSFRDTDGLAGLYAHAGRDWIDAGAREHYAWVLDRAERTAPWMDLGFARMHQRGVLALTEREPRALPEGYRARLGTIADLEWALDLGAEIDRVQAEGPSFSLEIGGDERAELTEALEDPEVRYFLAEHDGHPVAQCITFALPARRGSFDATLHLSAVAVRETHRGRGVGTALIDVALERARHHGFTYVETNWRVTNRGAARFWTGYGFEPTYVRLHRTVGEF